MCMQKIWTRNEFSGSDRRQQQQQQQQQITTFYSEVDDATVSV